MCMNDTSYVTFFYCFCKGASPNQDNAKGKTPVDLAQSETTLTLLCPLHYAAGAGMLDNIVALVANVRKNASLYGIPGEEGV